MYYSYYEDNEGRSLHIFDITEDNVKKNNKTGMMCHFYVEYNTFSQDKRYDVEIFIPDGAVMKITMREVDSVIVMRKLLDILFRKVE